MKPPCGKMPQSVVFFHFFAVIVFGLLLVVTIGHTARIFGSGLVLIHFLRQESVYLALKLEDFFP